MKETSKITYKLTQIRFSFTGNKEEAMSHFKWAVQKQLYVELTPLADNTFNVTVKDVFPTNDTICVPIVEEFRY